MAKDASRGKIFRITTVSHQCVLVWNNTFHHLTHVLWIASYTAERGYEYLGPNLTEDTRGYAHPTGARGYAIGDVMDPGTSTEVAYFGFGQTRYPDGEGGFLTTDRWGWDDENKTSYSLAPRSSYPRLDDMWVFDGTSWSKISVDFPGIGRTHPAMVAVDGRVYVGLGFGELCPCPLNETCPNCEPRPGIEDPRGLSNNLLDVYVYDVNGNEWSRIADFPYPAHHPFHFGLDGKAYIIGGHNSGVLYNQVHYYDEASDTWVKVAPVPTSPRVAGSQFVYGGYGCIIGGEGAPDGGGDLDGFGNSVVAAEEREHHRAFNKVGFFCYDPAVDEWVELPSPPGMSRWVPTTFVRDGFLYYLNGPIRTGQGDDFVSGWPTQGYRINLTDVVAYIEETIGEMEATDGPSSDAVDPTEAPTSSSTTTSTAALYGLALVLLVGSVMN